MSTLMLSTSPSRTNPKVLNGMRVAVPAYVFLALESGVTKVTFGLDGKVVRTETVAPWDFAGTGPNLKAYVYDFTKLSAGSHVITARVYKGAAVSTASATFTVLRPTTTAPVTPVGGAAGVPAPVVTTTPGPVLEEMAVVSAVSVTHAPYVQDMSYVAARA
jgi:hypothetical protein